MSKTLSIGEQLPMTHLQLSKRNLPKGSSQGALVKQPPEVLRVIQIYHSADNFLALFNPSKQVAYTRDIAKVFHGNAPSLGLVAKAFGSGTRDTWLDIQLTELAVFSGCKDKLSDYQVQNLIDIIAEEYGYLKVTELMYFFRKFKAGKYGKFYGAVDPLTITCALKDFLDDRRTTLNWIEKVEKEERERNDPKHIHYLRQYAAFERMARFYGYNFRSKDFTREDFEEIWWLFNLGYERVDHGYTE